MKKNSVHSVNLFSNWPSRVACSAVSFDPGRVHTIREITQKIFILSISFPYLQNVSHMWSSCRNDINRSIFCRIVVSKMLSDTQCALSAAILWYKVFCLQFLFFSLLAKKNLRSLLSSRTMFYRNFHCFRFFFILPFSFESRISAVISSVNAEYG